MNIRKDADPFKKYWWVLLLIFGATGGWVCLPLLDFGGASAGGGQGSRGLKAADQSLDSLANPQGAPGQALDLSMEGAYRKKAQAEGSQTSSLYQPPPEPAASAPKASALANLADALKAVSQRSDPTGWGGAAHEKGFNAPRANFSGLSGFGGGSGGGSGASLSLDSFGTAKPDVGMATTRGLGPLDLGAKSQGGARPVMGALQSAQSRSLAAVAHHSGDAASSLAGSAFDGSRGGTAISGPSAQQGGAYANLDAVPMNLKANKQDLSTNKSTPPPGLVQTPNTSNEMIKMMLMSLVSVAIGGLNLGIAGQMISTVMMMAMIQAEQQHAAKNMPKTAANSDPMRRFYGPEIRYS